MTAANSLANLLIVPSCGYPDDYVSSRLEPRLARMREQLDKSHNLDSDLWYEHRRTTIWIYGQLSQPVREQLKLIFLYLELPLLVTGVRLAATGSRQRASTLLEQSLWQRKIRRAVTTWQEPGQSDTALCALMARHGLIVPAREKPPRHALQSIEHRLFQGFYDAFPGQRPIRPVALCLAALCDLLNVARCRDLTRWPATNRLVPGGTLQRRDFRSPDTLRRSVGRRYGYADFTADPESSIKRGLTARLLREAHGGELATRVLALLWGSLTRMHQPGPTHANRGAA